MNWFTRSKHKRLRKEIFDLVTEIAQNCLACFNIISNEYPNASKKRQYESTIFTTLDAANVHTRDDIEMILDVSVRRHRDEDLSFYKVVCYVVDLHMPPEYNEIILTPTKSKLSVWGDEPEPSLEESFITTNQIVESIIPADI